MLQVIKGSQLGYQFDFQTNLTNQEALSILQGIGTEYAQSLVSQYKERGRLSPKQMFWVQVIALESTGVKIR